MYNCKKIGEKTESEGNSCTGISITHIAANEEIKWCHSRFHLMCSLKNRAQQP